MLHLLSKGHLKSILFAACIQSFMTLTGIMNCLPNLAILLLHQQHSLTKLDYHSSICSLTEFSDL